MWGFRASSSGRAHLRTLRTFAFGVLCTLLTSCLVEQPRVTDPARSRAQFDHQGVSTCNECHVKNLPIGAVGRPVPFDHKSSASASLPDCSACHLTDHASLGVTWAGGNWNHSPKPTSCADCHSIERPTSNAGWITPNPDAPFDFVSHGGAMDCAGCHNPSKYLTSSDWSPGHFAHPTSLTSCRDCHTPQRPTQIVNGFDHSGSTSIDCAGCHQATKSTNYSKLSDWSGGLAVSSGLVWDPAQDITLQTMTPVFNSTTITSVTSNTIKMHQGMLHSSAQIPSAVQNNCALCHASADSGVYIGAEYHPSISTQPSTCNDCHSSAVPSGFVGPINSSRLPASPDMKHDAVTWTVNSAGVWSATNTKIVTQDCSVCHKSPGTSWGSVRYHSSLDVARVAQPSSCLDCHANNRPKVAVPINPPIGVTPYDHANGGMGDCVSCHTSKSAWSGGNFHTTSPKPLTCVSCHGSQRPTNTTGFVGLNANAPFNYSTHGGSLDCATCHNSTTTFRQKSDWKGGFYSHSGTLSSCMGCHSTEVPQTVVNGFDHKTAGTGDCVGCHLISSTTNFLSMTGWAGGRSEPSGLVGSKTLNLPTIRLNYSGGKVISMSSYTQTVPEQMLHSSAQVPSSIAKNCGVCHANASSGVYSNGSFHASLTSAGLPQPTLCKDCHNGTLPQQIVSASANPPLTPTDHAAPFTSGGTLNSDYDCATCHTQTSSWSTGAKFHTKIGTKTPSNCTLCHSPITPLGISNKLLHSSSWVTQDCVTCHASPTLAQANNPSASHWAGGLYHSKISSQPTNCAGCHSPQLPASTTVSNYDSQHMSHVSAQVAPDCVSCHYSNLSLNPMQWSKSSMFHAIIPNPTSCRECHGLDNGSTVAGSGNDLPSGLTDSNTITTSSVAPSGTLDKITHTDVNVAGKDCNTCHTHIGMSGPKWKSATFHTNVPTLTMNQTTGRCDNCHMNVKPSVVVGGMDHSTIGTQDCSSCHNYPGTGSHGAGNWLGAALGTPHTTSFLVTYQNACVSCHTTSGSTTPPVGMPSGIINSGKTGRNGARIDFAHNFTSTTAGSTGTSTVTYNLTVCLGCHLPAATNASANNGLGFTNPNGWVGTGSFSNHRIPSAVDYAANPARITSATIQSCLPCHNIEGQRQHCTTGKFAPDCVRCHRTAGSWNATGGNPTCR